MIYLDHAAATPLSSAAKSAMRPFESADFFNPSAPYLPAKKVRAAYDTAKADLAHVVGAKASDLVITAGATESINLAFTVLEQNQKVLVLATEHDSVLNTAAAFPCEFIKVDKNGVINLKDLALKLTKDVSLVSVALVNNELGTIQPMAKISKIIKAEKQNRLKNGDKTPLYLHSDASQALGLLDLNVRRLGVDLLTLNSAKVYGPKGVGALYLSRGLKLKPLIKGGGQELGLRSGTENVAGLAGFSAAAVEAKKHVAKNRKLYENLKKTLKRELQAAKIPPLFLGSEKTQLSSFCPVSFPGLDAERLIYLLEEKEVYLSTGAACAASKGQVSKTLTAIGLSETEIAGSLRISLGALNDEENIRAAGREIVAAVNQEVERMKNA